MRHALYILLLALALTAGCWQSSQSGSGSSTDTFPEPDVEPGELLWAKRAGGLGMDQASGIAALPDGSCAVAGSYGGSATFGEGETYETSLPIEGLTDGFVARLGLNGNLVWARRIGGPEMDHAHGVAAFDDGSAIVVGDFEQDVTLESGGSSGVSLDSMGGKDGFVARYTLLGDNDWARAIGGEGFDTTDGVATDGGSSFRVLGIFEGTVVLGEGDPNETAITALVGKDVYVASLDTSGNLIWGAVVFADTSELNGSWVTKQRLAASCAQGGSTLLTGSWSCPATFAQGEPEQVVLNDGLAVVASFAADGALDFAFADGINGEGYSAGVAALPDGSIAIAGSFGVGWPFTIVVFGEGQPNETELVPPGDYSPRDVFIARYSSGSTLEWAIQAGGWTDDAAFDVAALGDDGLVVTGYHGDSAFFDPGGENEVELETDTYGQQRVFVARYDLDGGLVWVTSAGGGAQAAGQAIAVGADGCILVAGMFTGTAVFGEGEPHETTLKSAGQWDIFVAKYAP